MGRYDFDNLFNTNQYVDHIYDGLGDVAQRTNRKSIPTTALTYATATPYDAYGNSIITASSNKIGYKGYYRDSETGLYYLNARYYDSTMGRFTQSDPARQGGNLYGYCAGNPVMYSDPSGLWYTHGYNVYKETGDDIYTLASFLRTTVDQLDKYVGAQYIGFYGSCNLKGWADANPENVMAINMRDQSERIQRSGGVNFTMPTPTYNNPVSPPAEVVPIVDIIDGGGVYSCSNQLISFIKSYESCFLKSYDATGSGDWTIGWGHKLHEYSGNRNNPNIKWSQLEADNMFNSDLYRMLNTTFIPFLRGNNIKLNQQQFDAMVSFTFNFGEFTWSATEGYQTIRNFLLAGDYSEFATRKAFAIYMTKYTQDGKLRPEGHINRRNSEIEMFLYGRYTMNN